jgi:hypothetical protein
VPIVKSSTMPSSPVSTSVRFPPTTSRCSPITSCASRRIGPMLRRMPA